MCGALFELGLLVVEALLSGADVAVLCGEFVEPCAGVGLAFPQLGFGTGGVLLPCGEAGLPVVEEARLLVEFGVACGEGGAVGAEGLLESGAGLLEGVAVGLEGAGLRLRGAFDIGKSSLGGVDLSLHVEQVGFAAFEVGEALGEIGALGFHVCGVLTGGLLELLTSADQFAFAGLKFAGGGGGLLLALDEGGGLSFDRGGAIGEAGLGGVEFGGARVEFGEAGGEGFLLRGEVVGAGGAFGFSGGELCRLLLKASLAGEQILLGRPEIVDELLLLTDLSFKRAAFLFEPALLRLERGVTFLEFGADLFDFGEAVSEAILIGLRAFLQFGEFAETFGESFLLRRGLALEAGAGGFEFLERGVEGLLSGIESFFAGVEGAESFFHVASACLRVAGLLCGGGRGGPGLLLEGATGGFQFGGVGLQFAASGVKQFALARGGELIAFQGCGACGQFLLPTVESDVTFLGFEGALLDGGLAGVEFPGAGVEGGEALLQRGLAGGQGILLLPEEALLVRKAIGVSLERLAVEVEALARLRDLVADFLQLGDLVLQIVLPAFAVLAAALDVVAELLETFLLNDKGVDGVGDAAGFFVKLLFAGVEFGLPPIEGRASGVLLTEGLFGGGLPGFDAAEEIDERGLEGRDGVVHGFKQFGKGLSGRHARLNSFPPGGFRAALRTRGIGKNGDGGKRSRRASPIGDRRVR
ncbi:MAG: hypothetical protein EDS66_08480 [Planctomycetota bacterium]|nr:MAG: hypothetical protein EDS66_08480 [Planctomycetota bacterium]MCQ3921736.1 hypothetical protein [Planctomycetota bacterium]